MNTPLKKALLDLSANKSRTMLAIAAIFFGVFGMGLILDLYSVAGREMDVSFAATNPSSFSIRVNEYNDDLLASLSKASGVEEVEARRTVQGRTEVTPNVWRTSYLRVIENFSDVRIDKFFPVTGAPLPGIGEILIEKEALPVMGSQVGETAKIKISLNAPHILTIVGSVHAPGLSPAWMEKNVYGYITPETLDLLGVPIENCDLLFIVPEEIRFDKNAIREIAFYVRNMLLEKGYKAERVTIPEPGQHPHSDQLDSLLFLFQIFGGLSLVLSGVLVINMISSMMAGQVRQIGIMKAVGATRARLAGMYYGIVLISGAVALALAVPLAAVMSKMFVNVCAAMLNFSVSDYRIPLWPFVVQLAAGLLVPILAATYPILKGTGITVREALRDYGTNKQQFGDSLFDKCLSRIQGARRLTLAIRNTFRRKGRFIFTVATLAIGGAILIVSLNVKSSIDNTIDRAMDSLGYDLQYYFSKPYPADDVLQALQNIQSLEKSEILAGAMSSMVYDDGTENNAFQLTAVPGNMTTLNLPVLQGRFIEQGDTNAIVLNHAYLDDEPYLRVGNTVTIKTNGRNIDWVVVGIVKEVGAHAKAYVSRNYYQELFSQEGLARAVNIVTTEHTATAQQAVSILVEKALQDADIDVMSSSSFSDTRELFVNHIGIIAGFLVVASVLVIIVGVMGLVSATNMNVMERIREIGIMRSGGAVSKDILCIIIFESVLIGVISWIISCALSMPLSVIIGDTFGGIFLQTPLDKVLNPLGYVLWLIGITAITALVGFGVTLKILKMPVNEVLIYE